MKKAISILLLLSMLFSLSACRVDEEVIAVPSDAERVIQIALASESTIPAAEKPPAPPEVEYAEEQYSFSTTAADGNLNITADAQVRYPASLQLPIARMSAVGFTQEQASTYFEYFFAGEQPIVVEDYNEAKVTKQSLRKLIAMYEQQIADGTIMEQSMLYEDEAREEIKRLEALIPDAPETAPPDVISDGTMLPGVWMNNDDPEPSLELNAQTDDESLHIYTPVNADDHFTAHFFYNRRDRDRFSFPGTEQTELAPHTSIEGMTVTWDEAMQACEDFFALAGLKDIAIGKAYRVEQGGKLGYRFYFVRTVAGVPLAHRFEFTRHRGNTPWDYENIILTVDDGGLLSVQWGSPTKTTEIVNPAANAMPFAEAAEIFETMAVEIYDTEQNVGPGRNTDIRVDRIELSLLRIRDISTDERVGLYVPAWVFYGERFTNGYPHTNWTPQVVFAINAIDGSVINMELGY